MCPAFEWFFVTYYWPSYAYDVNSSLWFFYPMGARGFDILDSISCQFKVHSTPVSSAETLYIPFCSFSRLSKTTFLLGWSQISKGKGGWSLKISHAWTSFFINYWFDYWWQFISQFVMNCLLLALFTTLMINGLRCQTNIPITGGEWINWWLTETMHTYTYN